MTNFVYIFFSFIILRIVKMVLVRLMLHLVEIEIYIPCFHNEL